MRGPKAGSRQHRLPRPGEHLRGVLAGPATAGSAAPPNSCSSRRGRPVQQRSLPQPSIRACGCLTVPTIAPARARHAGIRDSERCAEPSAPAVTPSVYLHRRGDANGSAVGPFTVSGRASLCSLALIAAGSCERAAGSGGAERPREQSREVKRSVVMSRAMSHGTGAGWREDGTSGRSGSIRHDRPGHRRSRCVLSLPRPRSPVPSLSRRGCSPRAIWAN